MTKQEKIDVVDSRDRIIGASTVGECLDRGTLHRAVAVVITRPDGKVVLQQRSRRDSWNPGRWTLSCTGHVKKGESYTKAAVRELGEELGIEAELTLVKKYLLPPMTYGGLTEREWVSLFSGTSSSAVKIDPVELEGVKEFSVLELREVVDGDTLTPDAVILLSDFLRSPRKPTSH
jgi:isopentenyl-diphosphate Delta-isomerase